MLRNYLKISFREITWIRILIFVKVNKYAARLYRLTKEWFNNEGTSGLRISYAVQGKLVFIFLILVSTLNTAQINEITSKDVTFKSKDANISATVAYPNITGKLPAAVLVHGSGSSTRDNPWTTAYTEALSKRGIIVLYPDKRGSGKSGGDWKIASLFDLASDAIAGVDFLREQPEVDTSRIAVIGFSQGGDIVPIASALSYKIKMVIDLSGSVIPLKEQTIDEITKMGEREGLNNDQMIELKELYSLADQYVNDSTKWDAYASYLNNELKKGLGRYESFKNFPVDKDYWVWDWMKLVGDTDPLIYWKETKVPVLFIYGGNDTQLDIYKSINLIHTNLDPLNKNYSILYFGLNGHSLFREDCNDFIAEWIKDNGVH